MEENEEKNGGGILLNKTFYCVYVCVFILFFYFIFFYIKFVVVGYVLSLSLPLVLFVVSDEEIVDDEEYVVGE